MSIVSRPTNRSLKNEKQMWSIEEDILITILVEKLGSKKWNVIAEELRDRLSDSNRNGK